MDIRILTKGGNWLRLGGTHRMMSSAVRSDWLTSWSSFKKIVGEPGIEIVDISQPGLLKKFDIIAYTPAPILYKTIANAESSVELSIVSHTIIRIFIDRGEWQRAFSIYTLLCRHHMYKEPVLKSSTSVQGVKNTSPIKPTWARAGVVVPEFLFSLREIFLQQQDNLVDLYEFKTLSMQLALHSSATISDIDLLFAEVLAMPLLTPYQIQRAFNVVLNIYRVRKLGVSQMNDILEKLNVEFNFTPNLENYTTILSTLLNSEEHAAVLSLHRKMESEKTVDVRSFTIALISASKLYSMTKVRTFFDSIKTKTGNRPDKFAWNNLLQVTFWIILGLY